MAVELSWRQFNGVATGIIPKVTLSKDVSLVNWKGEHFHNGDLCD
jgi:hypothetical protein